MSRRTDDEARARELASLRQQVQNLSSTVTALREASIEQNRIQREALRRIFMLPKAVQQLVRAEAISDGKLDGTSLLFELGSTVTLRIAPFEETFTLADTSSTLHPLTLQFGKVNDLSSDDLLRVLGYVQLAGRDDLTGSHGFWTASLADLVTKTPARPTS